MSIKITGFNRLDFDEAKEIAKAVGFDVTACVKNVKSCGYGKYRLANDKIYFITMLLRHIDSMLQRNLSHTGCKNPGPEIMQWYNRARKSEREYREIEQYHLSMRRGNTSRG